MAVRNFAVEVTVGGKVHRILSSSDKLAGFDVVVKVRRLNAIADAMRVECKAFDDGVLQVEARVDPEFEGPSDDPLFVVSRR